MNAMFFVSKNPHLLPFIVQFIRISVIFSNCPFDL